MGAPSLLKPTSVLAWFLCVFLALPAKAQEENASGNPAAVSEVLPLIRGNADLQRNYQACPADVFRKETSLFSMFWTDGGMSAQACGADVKQCYESCALGKSGESCFRLALILETGSEAAANTDWDPLFNYSCALGRPSGCTNRAAGIRNGGYQHDLSEKWSEESRSLCLRRSFQIACKNDDAWGCAMYGQSLQLGEGGGADPSAAAAAFEKSCALDPDFPSCEFSKLHLKVLEIGRQAK